MLGTTPMFKQYSIIKEKYQDCILFYRMGDFYEMFGEDACTASKILGLVLTAREGGNGQKVPMCGVPFHSSEGYLDKLVQQGYKVAICEQVEDPKKAKGLVARDVIRIVTPGTVLSESSLRKEDNNYLAAVSFFKKKWGLAVADASTGVFRASEFDAFALLQNELNRYSPKECLYNIEAPDIKEKLSGIADQLLMRLSPQYGYVYEYQEAENFLKKHFQVQSLKSFGGENMKSAICASGALLNYIETTQKSPAANILKMTFYRTSDNMHIDKATRDNLELTRSLHYQDRKESLLAILDRTLTAPGARLLKSWLDAPLTKKSSIQLRLDATEELFRRTQTQIDLQQALQDIYDMERILSRVVYGTAHAKDLVALRTSLARLPQIKSILKELECPMYRELDMQFDTLQDIYDLLSQALVDNPPMSLREGGFIRDGYHQEVDSYREALRKGNAWLAQFLEKEKERTGIKNLKISSNKVFGLYIEVTKSYLHLVPSDYIRKQTLVNNERFITAELKELEEKTQGADEKLRELEYALFVALRTEVSRHAKRLLQTSHHIAILDVFQSLANVAQEQNFVKPTIHDSYSCEIHGLRHPIVERYLQDKPFVPNDVLFHKDRRFILITGPNMSGKSTYCRSVALAYIMMQIGSFVAADEAVMSVCDRVFARIGSSDFLAQGQSTFMVEMTEVANILHNASAQSLIILDEVGRGTATYDGLALAWSITRYINEQIGAKTLFATHYHELTDLEDHEGIVNASVQVVEDHERIVFLHKIVEGSADRSYGIQVAELAGLPALVTKYAKEILTHLENKPEADVHKGNILHTPLPDQLYVEKLELELKKYKDIFSEICSANIEDMSLREMSEAYLSLHDTLSEE